MKRYLLGLFAVVLAVGFSAFTNAKSTKFVQHFFQYTGTSYSDADYKNTSNWIYKGQSNPGDLCDGLDINPCVVKAEDITINQGTEVSDFVSFLSTTNPGGFADAKAYSESSSNYTAQKP